MRKLALGMPVNQKPTYNGEHDGYVTRANHSSRMNSTTKPLPIEEGLSTGSMMGDDAFKSQELNEESRKVELA